MASASRQARSRGPHRLSLARRPALRPGRCVSRRQSLRDDPLGGRTQRERRRRRRQLCFRLRRDRRRGAKIASGAGRGGGRYAAARAELLRLHQRLRPRPALAGPARLRAARTRRRLHHPILTPREQPDDGAALAADRLCDLPRQSGRRRAARSHRGDLGGFACNGRRAAHRGDRRRPRLRPRRRLRQGEGQIGDRAARRRWRVRPPSARRS